MRSHQKIFITGIISVVGFMYFSLTPFGSSLLQTLFPNLAQQPTITAQIDVCNQHQCSKDSQDENEYLDCIRDKQICLRDEISKAKEAQNTLSRTISIINGQISIQELQIEQTQTEIARLQRTILELTDRIAGLNVSLDNLSSVLVKRVGEHYKRQSLNPMLTMFTKGNINSAVSEYKYLQHAQEQTARAMQLAETQRITYDEQKLLLEETQTELAQKQASLETQQGQLAQQRADQQYLLQQNQQSEAKFQQELAKTTAELAAIQSIIAGRTSETEVRDVKAGDLIATVIEGASACSTGSHLHFEVVRNKAHLDPAQYLKSIDSVMWANGSDGPFGFGGNWDWPLDNPARVTQGYGMTYYARVQRAYSGSPHTGIDMFSRGYNFNVRAVADGTLSRGSVPCGGRILRYVRVDHEDSDLTSYYLHVNY
jgi:peptidoglycan hydrolase CwlO-like protein